MLEDLHAAWLILASFSAAVFNYNPITGNRKSMKINHFVDVHLECGPLPGCQSPPGLLWIITFIVGDPYKRSFPTVTGRGPHPVYLVKWLLGKANLFLKTFFQILNFRVL